MARTWRSEHELDDLSGVEIAAHEFRVGLVFFKGHDREMVRFHDWVANGGDAFKEVLSKGRGRTW